MNTPQTLAYSLSGIEHLNNYALSADSQIVNCLYGHTNTTKTRLSTNAFRPQLTGNNSLKKIIIINVK